MRFEAMWYDTGNERLVKISLPSESDYFSFKKELFKAPAVLQPPQEKVLLIISSLKFIENLEIQSANDESEQPPYSPAIAQLQLLSLLHNPQEKLQQVMMTMQLAVQCVELYWQKKDPKKKILVFVTLISKTHILQRGR